MNFSADKHYYIHNSGIDFNPIFFSEENKKYFRKKILHYISPYAKVINIKLADNQFHILIKTHDDYFGKSLNHNIGIMLRSYTNAINKQNNRIGSLFRQGTKAFEKLSDFPKYLRKFIKPFIEFIDKGKRINFPKTTNAFLIFINQVEKIKDKFFHNLNYEVVFDHPLKILD